MRFTAYPGKTLALVMACGLLAGSTALMAATLPAHEPLEILIIADEVNPHRLSDEQLTQPEDLSPALSHPDSGLEIGGIASINSQCIDEALQILENNNQPDVVLYFAHRAAKRCDGSDAQEELTSLMAQGLVQGVGVVMLHHGWFVDIFTPGAKESILQLLGARSTSINWDTETGQRIFNVAGDHFITTNGISYQQQTALSAIAGVPGGEYPYFDNVPDELYTASELLTTEDETRIPLFATNSQGDRLLGYVLTRPGWTGRVVAFQPGEYQPNALDDVNGPAFQILANAIFYAADDNPSEVETND